VTCLLARGILPIDCLLLNLWVSSL
jgi:hypothetical protein